MEGEKKMKLWRAGYEDMSYQTRKEVQWHA